MFDLYFYFCALTMSKKSWSRFFLIKNFCFFEIWISILADWIYYFYHRYIIFENDFWPKNWKNNSVWSEVLGIITSICISYNFFLNFCICYNTKNYFRISYLYNTIRISYIRNLNTNNYPYKKWFKKIFFQITDALSVFETVKKKSNSKDRVKVFHLIVSIKVRKIILL